MLEKQFLKSIGSKVKELRNGKKISQYDLANKCNFEKAGLSRIENGKSNPTVLTLYKLSKALDVNVKNFFQE